MYEILWILFSITYFSKFGHDEGLWSSVAWAPCHSLLNFILWASREFKQVDAGCLTGSSIKVVVNGFCYEYTPVKTVVAQGYVIAPMLFLLHINDMKILAFIAIQIISQWTEFFNRNSCAKYLVYSLLRLLARVAIWNYIWIVRIISCYGTFSHTRFMKPLITTQNLILI